jgi:hypothetical protein
VKNASLPWKFNKPTKESTAYMGAIRIIIIMALCSFGFFQ